MFRNSVLLHVLLYTAHTVSAPEVYTVIPLQPSERKPGQLEQWQLEEYFDKGFLVLPNFFTDEEMQQAIEVMDCTFTVTGTPHIYSSQISQWLLLIPPWLLISAKSSNFYHCSVYNLRPMYSFNELHLQEYPENGYEIF